MNEELADAIIRAFTTERSAHGEFNLVDTMHEIVLNEERRLLNEDAMIEALNNIADAIRFKR